MKISNNRSLLKQEEILTAHFTLKELEKELEKELALVNLMVDKARIDSFLNKLSISAVIVKNLDVRHGLGLKDRLIALVKRAEELSRFIDSYE